MHADRLLVLIVAAIAGSALTACRSAPSAEVAPLPAAAIPTGIPSPGALPRHEVTLNVSGTKMPGCFEPDEPFQAIIRSQWGQLESMNTLTHRWSPTPSGEDGVMVRIDGQALNKRLGPGDAFPIVSLRLPLGTVVVTAKISTFVFTAFDDEGRACFRWLNPPGVPPPFDILPRPNIDA